MNDSIRFEMAIYLLPNSEHRPKLNRLDQLSRLIKTRYNGFRMVEDLPEQPGEMLVRARLKTDIKKDYAPPDEAGLKYSAQGLTAAQKKALQASKEAVIFEFAHPKSQVWTALKSADELIEDVARQTGGLIWDKTTRLVFTPNEWHKIRLGDEVWADRVPTISSQTVIQIYPNGEYEREITLGMEKDGTTRRGGAGVTPIIWRNYIEPD